jgi:hypothetical protein
MQIVCQGKHQTCCSLVPQATTWFGELSDQAALAGVLNTLYELHLPVLSVARLSAG